MSDTFKLLRPKDLVEMGVATSTAALATMRYRGTGPTFVKLGGGKTARVAYLESDVAEWLNNQRQQSSRPIEGEGES